MDYKVWEILFSYCFVLHRQARMSFLGRFRTAYLNWEHAWFDVVKHSCSAIALLGDKSWRRVILPTPLPLYQADLELLAHLLLLV